MRIFSQRVTQLHVSLFKNETKNWVFSKATTGPWNKAIEEVFETVHLKKCIYLCSQEKSYKERKPVKPRNLTHFSHINLSKQQILGKSDIIIVWAPHTRNERKTFGGASLKPIQDGRKRSEKWAEMCICVQWIMQPTYKCFVLLFEVWMEKKYVFYPQPLSYTSNSQSFATIYVRHTKQKRKHSSTQNVGGIFFRKVLDAGKLHLLEDLEYQVGAKRQHKHLICIYKHGVQGRARKEVYYNPFTLQIWNR